MQATIEKEGEIREATVNDSGSIYVGSEWIGKDVKIAFEVIEDD